MVACGSMTDETAEYSMDDGFAIRVGARLETDITDIGLANETELLGKKIAGFLGCVCDCEWEYYIAEAQTGDVAYTPRYADEPHS